MIGMNRLSGTREAVEAVLASTEKFHLFLTNQNSTDGTGEYFEEVKKRFPDRVTVFHEKQNTFFQPPNNRAYRLSAKMGCEFFLCLNDDAIIPQYGLAKMMQVMDLNPKVAIVGSQGGCQELSPSFHGQPGKLEFVEGSCMMVRINALRKHRQTLFWEKLEGIYSEDSELSLFMQEKGWEIAKAEFDLPHARSQTVNRDLATQAACKAYQERNHQLCVKRYAHWVKCRRFNFPIVLRRKMALGDVILLTPIVRSLKQAYPLSDIHVETDFPEVFTNNPHVLSAEKSVEPMQDELRIDLNDAYEGTAMTHILQAYEDVTRERAPALEKVDWVTELFPNKRDIQWAQAIKAKMEGQKMCVVHGDASHWPGKHIPTPLLEQVVSTLRRSGWRVVLVGANRRIPGIGCDLDLTSETTVLQLSALCSMSDLFLGMDSGPMHVAQASRCPVVSLFGVTSPRFIMTHGSRFAAVESSPEIASTGLRHRKLGVQFATEGKDAMESLTHSQVMEAIATLAL